MLITSFKTAVHAQIDTIWGLLLDRIEHPERYQPRVTGTRIVERFHNGVIRESTIDGWPVRERIEVTEERWNIRSELLEHPEYSGYIDTRLLNTSVQNPMAPVHLDMNVRLELKEGHREGLVGPDQALEESINDELARIKARAEELEKQA